MRIGHIELPSTSFIQYFVCGLLSGLSLDTLVDVSDSHAITVNERKRRPYKRHAFAPFLLFTIDLHDVTYQCADRTRCCCHGYRQVPERYELEHLHKLLVLLVQGQHMVPI